LWIQATAPGPQDKLAGECLGQSVALEPKATAVLILCWNAAFAPDILLLPPLRRFWICAIATAWLGLALATRFPYAVLASPSQDILSGS